MALALSPLSCLTMQGAERKDAPVTKSAFDTGMHYYREMDYSRARANFQDFLEEHPESPQAAEACLFLGKIALYERKYAVAEGHFKDVSSLYPDSEFVSEASHLLSVVESERRRAEEADRIYQLQKKKENARNEGERKQATEELLTLLSEQNAYFEAFVNALELLPNTTGSERKAAEDRVITMVERLSAADAQKALEAVSGRSFPEGCLRVRLGRLAMHTRDFKAAQEHFAIVNNRFPEHPLADLARTSLERLDKRFQVAPGTLGVLLPLSGRFKPVGMRIKRAIDLAVNVIDGESLGRLKVVIADTQSTEIGTREAFERLVLEEQAIAIAGPVLGAVSEAAAYKAEEFEIPLVNLSTREGVPQIGTHVFRVAMTPHMQAKTLVDYAWNILGYRTFAILYPEHPYGEDMAHAFWDEVRNRGGWITGVESYADNKTMFKHEVRSLVGRYEMIFGERGRRRCDDPLGLACGEVRTHYDEEDGWPRVDFEALFIPDSAKKAGMIAPALPFEEVELNTRLRATYRRAERKRRRHRKEVKLVQLLGPNAWNNPNLSKFGGKWAEGAFFCDGFFAADESNLITNAFVQSFTKRFGTSPHALEAYAYDALLLLGRTVIQHQPKTREELRTLLAAIKDYEGATGHMGFDEQGELVNDLLMLTLHNEEIIPAPETIDVNAPWIFTEKDLEEQQEKQKQRELERKRKNSAETEDESSE